MPNKKAIVTEKYLQECFDSFHEQRLNDPTLFENYVFALGILTGVPNDKAIDYAKKWANYYFNNTAVDYGERRSFTDSDGRFLVLYFDTSPLSE